MSIIKEIYEKMVRLAYRFSSLIEYVGRRSKIRKNDYRAIRELRNCHKDEKCFIVGTGPSLNVSDLNMIAREHCIGVNGAYKACSETEWRPEYYYLEDDNFAIETYEEIIKSIGDYKTFFFSGEGGVGLSREKNIFLPKISTTVFGACDKRVKHRTTKEVGTKISSDISKKVYSGKTVIYGAIQIAIYLGFKDIYLLGVDCNFSKKNKHSEIVGDDIPISSEERRRLGKAAQMMMEQFDGLAQLLPYYGVNIYNATRGGMLEAFPRVRLEDIIVQSE